MPSTLQQYIADTRRLSRLVSPLPFSDTDIREFINEAKDYVSSLVPFAPAVLYFNGEVGKQIYTITPDVLQVLSCLIYPQRSSRLAADLDVNQTSLVVDSANGFPQQGHLLIGEPPDVEIVQYTAVTGNTFSGLTRGRFGTAPRSFTAANNVPVRFWNENTEWLNLVPQTDVTLFQETKMATRFDVSTTPTLFSVRGGLLMFNQPFSTDIYKGIMLYALIKPGDLVNNNDVIYGLPEAYERLIPITATMFILKAIGGDDVGFKYQALEQEFQFFISRLREYVDGTVRGVYGAIVPETVRSATRQGRPVV